MTIYNSEFYKQQQDNSKKSAVNIVPFLMDIIKPKSVVDIGCGVGTWLSVFIENGVTEVLGVDGGYIDKEMLHISKNLFLEHDLTKPLKVSDKFDLVVSLEVAEHILEESSDVYLSSLVNLGKVIMFSAAIPSQGGTGHFNEQWPDYWIQKFELLNFEVLDIIRPKIWAETENAFWYNQNILLFIEKDYLKSSEVLQNIKNDNINFQGLSIVHPELFIKKSNEVVDLYRSVFGKMFMTGNLELITQFRGSNHPIVCFYIGRAYKELKEFDACILYLENYLDSADDHFRLSASYHLAEVYYSINNIKRAKELFLQCQKLSKGTHVLASEYLKRIDALNKFR